MAESFQQAFELHQQGQLEQARQGYEFVLGRFPTHFDAMHMAGLLAVQQGRLEDAIALLQRALMLKPGHPPVLGNLGAALQRMGRLDEALARFDEAIAAKPDYVNAMNNRSLVLKAMGRIDEAMAGFDQAAKAAPQQAEAVALKGQMLQELGRISEALVLFDRALALSPQQPEVLNNRAVALMTRGRVEEALANLDSALALRPDHMNALVNRGAALKELGRLPEALESFQRVLATSPGRIGAWVNRGNVLLAMQRPGEALASFDNALGLDPRHADALLNRGTALKDLERYGEALEACDAALAVKPDFPEALLNRGNILVFLGRTQEALAAYDRALQLQPASSEALINRGNVLLELDRRDEALDSYSEAARHSGGDPKFLVDVSFNRGTALLEALRLDDAIEAFDHALALNPAHADTRWNKSNALLLKGDYRNGLPLFEERPSRRNPLHPKLKAAAPWLGEEDIGGKTLFVAAEEGLGDAIQYARFIPALKQRGARVIVETPAALTELFTQTPADSIVASGGEPPEFDHWIPASSLMLALGVIAKTIPSAGGYFTADAARTEAWRKRLGEGPRVGLVWSGFAGHKRDHERSLKLADLLAKLPDGPRYVSLHKEVRERDLDALAGIQHFGDDLANFADTAALIAAMDIVVGVDTSIVHMAGALGKRTWVLLAHRPDWRWMLGRSDSPWYDAMTLYRQPEPGDWNSVLEQLGSDLGKL